MLPAQEWAAATLIWPFAGQVDGFLDCVKTEVGAPPQRPTVRKKEPPLQLAHERLPPRGPVSPTLLHLFTFKPPLPLFSANATDCGHEK